MLRINRPVAFSSDRVAGERIVEVEVVTREGAAAQGGIGQLHAAQALVRVESGIVRIWLVVNRAGRDVVGISRGDRVANELMVLLLSDVDQAEQAAIDRILLVADRRIVVVTVDVSRIRKHKTRVAALRGEIRRVAVAESRCGSE